MIKLPLCGTWRQRNGSNNLNFMQVIKVCWWVGFGAFSLQIAAFSRSYPLLFFSPISFFILTKRELHYLQVQHLMSTGEIMFLLQPAPQTIWYMFAKLEKTVLLKLFLAIRFVLVIIRLLLISGHHANCSSRPMVKKS